MTVTRIKADQQEGLENPICNPVELVRSELFTRLYFKDGVRFQVELSLPGVLGARTAFGFKSNFRCQVLSIAVDNGGAVDWVFGA